MTHRKITKKKKIIQTQYISNGQPLREQTLCLHNSLCVQCFAFIEVLNLGRMEVELRCGVNNMPIPQKNGMLDRFRSAPSQVVSQ